MPKERVTLLVDADIVAYKAAVRHQEEYDWGDGPSIVADMDEATESIKRFVGWLQNELEPDEIIMCLSDDIHSFRKEMVDRTYKAPRGEVERPVILYDLKEWIAENYRFYRKPTLEADDVMGILSTHPKVIPGKKIIVSEDKDMRTIPGWLFNPDKYTTPVLISEQDADWFWLWQTLTGDVTDGYSGCPGVGPVVADDELNEAIYTAADEGIPYLWELWDTVVSIYKWKGLTEEDALRQARMARILRFTDYNPKTGVPILWEPRSMTE